MEEGRTSTAVNGKRKAVLCRQWEKKGCPLQAMEEWHSLRAPIQKITISVIDSLISRQRLFLYLVKTQNTHAATHTGSGIKVNA